MRVLVVITTSLVKFGGIANAFMNYYRKMDFDDLMIDVASCKHYDETMADEICKNGGNCYAVPAKQKDLLKYLIAIDHIMKKGYDVIDIHGNSSTMVLELYLAKKNGIKNRMAHCLNSRTNYPILHSLLRVPFNQLCTTKTACTKEAGIFLYGDNEYTILKNVIETEKYKFSKEWRKLIRQQYGFKENEIIIGTVGKINQQKNHGFLIEIFAILSKEIENAKLLIVGDGPMRNDIENLIKKKNIEKKVILTGMITNVIPYYSAFDIYLFPSIFEGLSLALLEAKCTGLVGIASKDIEIEDGDHSNFIKYRPLDVKIWVNEIKRLYEKKEYLDREEKSDIAIKIIKQDGFDSSEGANLLKELYFQT